MLLLLPLDRKIDWKKPPLATIGLVLLCCAVFFFVQGPDRERWRAAGNHYFSTELPAVEFPAYIDDLRRRGEFEQANAVRQAMVELEEKSPSDPRAQWLLRTLQGDRAFVDRLERGEVITADHPQYDAWRTARNEFHWHYRRIVTPAYAFHYGDPVTWVTSMFLHGGFLHLLGNMVFLFVVGFTVERILGSPQFLFSYLAGGLAATGLWAAVYGDTGALGASGAISAVMGMYAVLFGLRKIRFFYLVLFYFDYVRAPALVLLPLWLANELYGLYAGHAGIGYMAHIGGFAGGTLIAFSQTRLFHSTDVDYLEAPVREEQYAHDYERALNLVGALKFDQAKPVFLDLLEKNPADSAVLRQLYTITREQPESDDYHRIARRILGLQSDDPATLRLVNDTFEDYSARAKPTMRLQPGALAELAGTLARGAYTVAAERIVLYLMRKLPTLPQLPDALLALTEGFHRSGQQRKYEQYLRILSNAYPDSQAAQRARRLYRA